MIAKLNVKPLFDNVLVKPLEAEEKTPSGIILPDNAKEKPQVGQIVAIGTGHVTPDGKTLPMVVRVGQKIMYKKWGGDETKIGSEDYVVVKQGDILAILE